MYLTIIQSRNGSSRLPNKSSLSLAGFPTLLHLINRLRKVKFKNFGIIVATSVNKEDDPLFNLCKLNNVPCFRGDGLDVFSRFKLIVKQYKPEYVIRITGDCPLIFSPIIEELINLTLKDQSIDYASNIISRTYPHGMDVEIFKSKILLDHKDPSASDIEHVTPFIYNSKNMKIFSYEHEENLSKYRITLDTFMDFIFLDRLLLEYKIKFKDSNIFDIISPIEISNLICNNNKLSSLHQEAKDNSNFVY